MRPGVSPEDTMTVEVEKAGRPLVGEWVQKVPSA
jgi:hypothetical protein